MGKVESLQEQVQLLSLEELAQFRAWFLDLDWATWDSELERDIEAGRLDALAERALDGAVEKVTRPSGRRLAALASSSASRVVACVAWPGVRSRYG